MPPASARPASVRFDPSGGCRTQKRTGLRSVEGLLPPNSLSVTDLTGFSIGLSYQEASPLSGESPAGTTGQGSTGQGATGQGATGAPGTPTAPPGRQGGFDPIMI